MIRVALLLTALSWMAGCGREPAPDIPSEPVEWSVTASTSTREVQVGDDFTFTLSISHPAGGAPIPPSAADFEPFEVLETWTEARTPFETNLHFRLAAYRLPEELEISSLAVRYRDEAGEIASVESEPVSVSVVTSLTPEVTDIHDIKDPMALEVPRDWSLLLWLLAALVASLLAYIIYRKFRKEVDDEAASPWVPPLPPAHEEAEAALTRLRQKGLIERGEIALFYTELTDIVKRYLGRRFEVPYLERTTEEILSDLDAKDVSSEPARAILEVADLVKFAKQTPGAQEASTSLYMAFDLVRHTRPTPPAAKLEATA